MEFLIIPCSLLFTFACIFLALFNTANRSNSNKKSLKGLPHGPRKLPFLGNIHQFVGSLPHRTLRNLASQYGPLMHLQLGEKPHIIVSSADIAKEIMKTHDVIFANRPNLLASKFCVYADSDIAFSSHGRFWRELKKICISELLSTKHVQSLRHIREEEVSKLVRNIHANEGSVINLTKEIESLTIALLARAANGKRCKEQEAFISATGQMLKLLGGFCVADFYPSIKVLPLLTGMKAKLERAQRETDKILDNMVKDHNEPNAVGGIVNDFIHILLQTQKKDDLQIPLSLNNIKAIVWDMFVGGTGAPSAVIVWAMSELMKNPKVMEKAQSEVRKVFNVKGCVDETDLQQLQYLNSVIKETLRLHPPEALLLPRENSESCVINGYEIPAKSKTIINAWAIARDPKYWSEAERFLPERFLDNSIDFKGTHFEYIPFGAGRRICPGIAFSMCNILLSLANLLYHFDWKLPNGANPQELDMTESFGLLVKRANDLCLVPTLYHPSVRTI
ncbi:cytochrome P450 71D10-like [Abrus precatorius]|uniref:Cytochrome P450 71D10-like n=1 Tax=Abrus precatorius TaxID=3816 RepID=A0A8B8KWT2_ABRPR|nr:cytochrome P450 71D10-like [Abrus precatorius]